jgi:MoaA/NifB/PqqE/SkfB family radical SAM enzyme
MDLTANELVEAGAQMHQSGAWPKAYAAYRKGIALHPARPDALHLLGLLEHQNANPAAALSWMNRALDITPDVAVFHANLADVLRLNGRLGEAIEHLRKAVRLDPGPADPRAALASWLIMSGRSREGAIASVDEEMVALPPIRIRIETASACNLRCQHCPTGVAYDATDRSVFKMASFDRLVAQMAGIPSIRDAVLYLGGEPLLNKHLSLMCRRLKAETHVVSTSFVTNAMLLTERNCTELAGSLVDHITISIDGRSPEENDKIRLGADFWTIKRNVEMLQRHLKGTRTKVTISNITMRRPEDPPIAVAPAFIAEHFPDIDCAPHYAMVWPGLDVLDANLPGATVHHRDARQFCALPFYEISVRASGDALLCCYDIAAEHVMGNVFHSDLMTVWNSPAYRNLRRAIVRGDVGSLPDVCQKCVIYSGKMIEL